MFYTGTDWVIWGDSERPSANEREDGGMGERSRTREQQEYVYYLQQWHRLLALQERVEQGDAEAGEDVVALRRGRLVTEDVAELGDFLGEAVS